MKMRVIKFSKVMLCFTMLLFLAACKSTLDLCWFSLGNSITQVNSESLRAVSVAMNDTGDIIAFGHKSTGSNIAYAYTLQNGSWVPLGTNEGVIATFANIDIREIVINDTGDIVAIATNEPSVYVYQYNTNTQTWSSYGNTITSEGSAISLNAQGNRLAVGTATADSVKVYSYNSGTAMWDVVGSAITGDSSFGSSLDLNGDGTRVVISAPLSGYVETWQESGGTWSLLGNRIDKDNTYSKTLGTDTDSIEIGDSVRINFVGDKIVLTVQRNATIAEKLSSIVSTDILTFVNNDWDIENNVLGTSLDQSNVISDLGKRIVFMSQSTVSNNTIKIYGLEIFSIKIRFGGTIIDQETEQFGQLGNNIDAASVISTLNNRTVSMNGEGDRIAVASSGGVQIYVAFKPCPTSFAELYRQVVTSSFPSSSAEAQNISGTNPQLVGAGFKTLVGNVLRNAHLSKVSQEKIASFSINLISDLLEHSFEIIIPGENNGRIFTAKGLQGTITIDSATNAYTYTQTGQVTGVLKEADGTVVDSMAILSGATITNINVEGALANNTLNVTDIIMGTITQGTITASGPATFELGNNVETSPSVTIGLGGPFPASSTFTFSAQDLSGATLSNGTYMSGSPDSYSGATIALTGSITGTVTIATGTYAGTYTNVSLTNPTISNATVTGATNSGTFTGDTITSGNITAGTLGIVFIDMPLASSPAFTINGGDLDTAVFTVTSGTTTAYVIGDPSTIIGGSGPGGGASASISALSSIQIPGAGAVAGSIPGSVVGLTDSFTSVPLAFALFTGLSGTGSSSSINLFTASNITAGTISNGGFVFPLNLAFDATASGAFTIIGSGAYNGETFTFANDGINNMLAGELTVGDLNGSGSVTATSVSGTTIDLDALELCKEGVISNQGGGPDTVEGVPQISIANYTLNGSFTGLTFVATTLSGQLDENNVTLTPGNTCGMGPMV